MIHKVPLSLKKYLPSMCEVTLFLPVNTQNNGLFCFISSYTVPVGSPRVACMIEMTADGKPPIQKQDTETPHVSQVVMQIASSKHY